jgi:uncharacterized protein (TIGR00251 family)
LDVRPSEGGVTLRVRVQPRASRNALAGTREGALVVRLTSPPVEGEANASLISFIAGALRVARSDVRLLRGHKAREKLLQVRGVSQADVVDLLSSSPRARG